MQVFLSYSRKDTTMMQRVRTDLENEIPDLTVWTDEHLVPGDASWRREIQAAIENSQALIVLLSPDSKQSEWVNEEWGYARSQGVRVIPALIRGDARTAVPFGLDSAQRVDLCTKYDAAMGRLVNALCNLLGLESRIEIEKSLADNEGDKNYSELTSEINNWLDAGQKGDAPVDLSEFDIVLEDKSAKDVTQEGAEEPKSTDDILENGELDALLSALRERRDLKRLGDAVYKAEGIVQQGKAKHDLEKVAKEAREFFDQRRKEVGLTTTLMRFSDLDARVQARELITERLAEGQTNVWDATVGEYRDIAEMLKEANAHIEDASEAVVSEVLELVRELAQTQPEWVQKRLREAMGRPLSKHHYKLLENKLAEIDKYIEDQNRN